MKWAYITKVFRPETLRMIAVANTIIEDYLEQGLVLTLRQLYYRFVAADLIPNTQRAYKKLGSVVNDGRLAGLIDWEAIEDRGRAPILREHWENPGEIILTAAKAYRIDKWQEQENYVEVWVEKAALEAVVDLACKPLDVSCFSCRGYTSQSEMWRAAERFKEQEAILKRCIIIHLGDHDPSGLDMTRDIRDRLNSVFGVSVLVDRLALNMYQVEEFKPPPNPAKLTDSRAAGYCKEFGPNSWELDALEPSVLQDMIQSNIRQWLDEELFLKYAHREENERRELIHEAEEWGDPK